MRKSTSKNKTFVRENHLPPLVDPGSVKSQFEPGDFVLAPYSPTEEEKKDVALVMQCFRSSADAKRLHQWKWFESLAFYLGNQWVQWSPVSSSLRSVRDPKAPNKIYTTHNKIKPLVKTMVARATQNMPQCEVVPDTMADIDVAAAAEARAVTDHYNTLFERPKQIQRVLKYCLTTSTTCIKFWWDTQAWADVPVLDGEGNVTGQVRAQVGELCEEIIPIFQLYPDPKATVFEKMKYLIHAVNVPLSDIQAKYPNGKYVERGGNANDVAYADQRMAAVTGDYNRTGSEEGRQTAPVIEYWEKPTQRYPYGRVITIANEVLLSYEEKWPFVYKNGKGEEQVYTDRFPFEYCDFEEGIGSVYGLNVVEDCIAPQRDYNRRLSQRQNKANSAYGKIVVERMSDIGPNAFDSSRENEIIYKNVGSAQIQQLMPAPEPPEFAQLQQLDQADLEDITGAHKVSQGTVPPGITAGNAIDMLMNADQSQMKEFQNNVESFVARIGQWEVRIAAQYYDEPRLLNVSQGAQKNATTALTAMLMQKSAPPAPPQGMQGPQVMNGSQGMPGAPQGAGPQQMPGASTYLAQKQVFAFRNLTRGGSCKIRVVPGSGSPKSPAARNQWVLDMFRAGIFGNQMDPQAGAIALRMMDLAQSDAAVEELMALKQQQLLLGLASQPNPQALQAQQQAAQQAAQQAQQQAAQQHEAQIAAIEEQSKIAVNKAKSDAQFQLEQAKAQWKLTGQIESQHHEIGLMEAERAVPKVVLQANADKSGTQSLERSLGYGGG